MNKTKIRQSLTPLFPVLDVLLSPFTLLASILLFGIRKMRMSNTPVSKKIFRKVGVFPITNHYYEPLFDDRQMKLPLNRMRNLPGIDWNLQEQLSLLSKFHYQEELLAFPYKKPSGGHSYFYDNPSLGPGDAEYLYSIIRHFKPRRIIEVGSGYSTLMMIAAIEKNRSENPAYECTTICIEPYEMPWLEKTGVQVVRKLVEQMDLSFFQTLGENDILFIDSSHVIRPQGDVLYEFLEILPSIAPGVIVHVHDIFTPGDYRKELIDEVTFWNEQYLLEAFLSCNKQFRIIGALHYLKNYCGEDIMAKLPLLKKHPATEPGSFWMRKV
jgi:predicted O-methyltransferase YrrM